MRRRFAATIKAAASWVSDGRRRRMVEAEQACAEAGAMILRHGELAYSIARGWARNEELTGRLDPFRPKGHWTRVRQEIGRQTEHVAMDSATRRYLMEP